MQKEFCPKVSIIIPVYNGANYLKQAIDSAINQRYKNIEIIVVNDGSNDNGKTEKIAISYGKKIRYIYKENGGVASALNVGIRNMEGEYFSWLSHDDLYEEDKVYNQINMLSKLEDKKTLICCRYKVVNKDLKYIQENSFGKEKDRLIYPAVKFLLKGYIHGCCLLIHKSYFNKVGIFNEKLKTTQDFDLWFRMTRNQQIYFNNEIGVISRAHEEQDSKKMFKYHLEECDELWIKMVDQLSEMEKIEISGSVFEFFKEVYDFLSINTPYEESVKYLRQKFLETLKQELQDKGMLEEFLELTEYCEVKNQNIALNKQLKDITNSRSWKITAPMRNLVYKMKKLVNRNKKEGNNE